MAEDRSDVVRFAMEQMWVVIREHTKRLEQLEQDLARLKAALSDFVRAGETPPADTD